MGTVQRASSYKSMKFRHVLGKLSTKVMASVPRVHEVEWKIAEAFTRSVVGSHGASMIIRRGSTMSTSAIRVQNGKGK